MALQRIRLGDFIANPFRGSLLIQEKITALLEDAKKVNGIRGAYVARPSPTQAGKYEIGKGHHRLAADIALHGEHFEVDADVSEFTDAEMEDLMLQDNRAAYQQHPAVLLAMTANIRRMGGKKDEFLAQHVADDFTSQCFWKAAELLQEGKTSLDVFYPIPTVGSAVYFMKSILGVRRSPGGKSRKSDIISGASRVLSLNIEEQIALVQKTRGTTESSWERALRDNIGKLDVARPRNFKEPLGQIKKAMARIEKSKKLSESQCLEAWAVAEHFARVMKDKAMLARDCSTLPHLEPTQDRTDNQEAAADVDYLDMEG